MNKVQSTSSLSPFEDEQNQNKQYFKQSKKNRVFDKQQSFSQFEQDNMKELDSDHYRKMLLKSNENVKKLKLQIQTLKVQKNKLQLNNTKLLEQIQLLKRASILKQTNSKLVKDQLQKQTKRQRADHLIKQVLRIKQNMSSIREQSQKYKAQIIKLKNIIQEQQQQKIYWKWKDNFIDLFIDMVNKISNDISEDWTDKKKIQIGWKIVKSLIYKAMESGIRPSRVQKKYF